MKKDKISIEAIKQDLLKVINLQLSYKRDWLFSSVIPITLFAVLLCIILHNIFIILLIFLIAAYHIFRYLIKYMECKKSKNAILNLTKREEIFISKETFSHIASKEIYEPYKLGTKARTTKPVTVYYFDGGTSWRVPRVDKHYSWSNEFHITSKGLENTSLSGDEFFVIGLQNHPDISYIYPCKNFELDVNLSK